MDFSPKVTSRIRSGFTSKIRPITCRFGGITPVSRYPLKQYGLVVQKSGIHSPVEVGSLSVYPNNIPRFYTPSQTVVVLFGISEPNQQYHLRIRQNPNIIRVRGGRLHHGQMLWFQLVFDSKNFSKLTYLKGSNWVSFTQVVSSNLQPSS